MAQGCGSILLYSCENQTIGADFTKSSHNTLLECFLLKFIFQTRIYQCSRALLFAVYWISNFPIKVNYSILKADCNLFETDVRKAGLDRARAVQCPHPQREEQCHPPGFRESQEGGNALHGGGGLRRQHPRC